MRSTLARVARSFHERVIEPNRSSKLSADWINSLENHVPKALWERSIAEVTRLELLEFLREHQSKMLDTAQRVRIRLEEVYDDAIEHGLVTNNPVTTLRLKLRKEHKANKPSKRRRSFPSMPYRAVPDFLTRLRRQPGIAAHCLELTILTASRTAETLGAEWKEISTWTQRCGPFQGLV